MSFNKNHLKKQIKEWIEKNPNRSNQEISEYCENLIPAHQYHNNKWIINQIISWYMYIMSYNK